MAAIKSVANRVKGFVEFALGVFWGLLIALTNDVNVFLIGISAVLVSFSTTRPAGVVLLIYAILKLVNEWVGAVVQASKGGGSSG
jgi:hypothetical protein